MNPIPALCIAQLAAAVVAVPLFPRLLEDRSSIKSVDRRLDISRKSAP
jgi:hypothetical protein